MMRDTDLLLWPWNVYTWVCLHTYVWFTNCVCKYVSMHASITHIKKRGRSRRSDSKGEAREEIRREYSSHPGFSWCRKKASELPHTLGIIPGSKGEDPPPLTILWTWVALQSPYKRRYLEKVPLCFTGGQDFEESGNEPPIANNVSTQISVCCGADETSTLVQWSENKALYAPKLSSLLWRSFHSDRRHTACLSTQV